jgi:hypothetical protein
MRHSGYRGRILKSMDTGKRETKAEYVSPLCRPSRFYASVKM